MKKGIHPENYDLIFTPFWQEDESRTRNVGGKGLGLSIVKNIVSMSNIFTSK